MAEDLNALLPEIGADDLAVRKAKREVFEAACLAAGRPGAEEERAAAAKAVVAMLAKDIPQTSRVWLLRQLMLIGGDESVAAAAGLLADKDAEVRDAARRALQKIAAPGAAEALRKALEGATDAPARVAMINALGGRGEPGNAAAIARHLADPDPAVARAAAAAVSGSGGPDAVKALSDARAKAAGGLRAAGADALLEIAGRAIAGARYDDAAAICKTLDAEGETERVRGAARATLAAVDLSRKAGRVTYP